MSSICVRWCEENKTGNCMYCDDPAMLNNNLGKFSYTFDAEKAFGHPCTCHISKPFKNHCFPEDYGQHS